MGEALGQVIFKICGKTAEGSYKNTDAVEKVIGYVLRKPARKQDDLWGSIGTFSKTREGIIKDFYKLKRIYGKEDGLQLKHLMLSWGKRPEIPRKKMRRLLNRTVCLWGMDYQAVYAVHEDKSDGYHMHIVLNSVSNEGCKIQITGKKLAQFRKKFNNIWGLYGGRGIEMGGTGREMFLGMLHGELRRFKKSMLLNSKESIFGEPYWIEVSINLYEILAEQAGQMQEGFLPGLAEEGIGILESLYLSCSLRTGRKAEIRRS